MGSYGGSLGEIMIKKKWYVPIILMPRFSDDILTYVVYNEVYNGVIRTFDAEFIPKGLVDILEIGPEGISQNIKLSDNREKTLNYILKKINNLKENYYDVDGYGILVLDENYNGIDVEWTWIEKYE